ncbi:MAG: hypothetical protein PHE95_04925, partial [Candidatus Methanomethylophilus sp.]|nr:hypothetical protein [Methanomethylophilus sp.]
GPELLGLFDRTAQAWLDRDAVAAEQGITDGNKAVEHITQVFSVPTDGSDAQEAGLIAGSAKRLAEYCLDISESAINSAME